MTIEQLRREVVRAITNVVRSNILAVDFTITVEAVRAAFDAYDKAVIAANKPITHRWNIELDGDDLLICDGSHDKGEECKFVRYARVAARPTFEGDEAEVREPGWSKVMLWLEERMNFPTQSQPLRLAALKMCGEHYLANKRCDAALSRAEQAEAALAEERKAMSEAASYAIEDLREWLVNYPDAYDRDTTEQAITTLSRFILPAKPAVDPLIGIVGEALMERSIFTTHRAESVAKYIRAAIERAGGVKAVFGEGV